MGRLSPAAAVVGLVAVLAVPSASPNAQVADRTAAVLADLGSTILSWEQALTNIVAEERYTQDRLAYFPQLDQTVRLRRRTLTSDLLLVRLDDERGLVPFRDVFEVDGRPVRDRNDRLVKLFLHPTPETLAQARAIVNDGARFNVGTNRNVTVPLLALAVIEPSMQRRFAFSGSPAGGGTWRLKFRETGRPTFVRGAGGRDTPIDGAIDVDPTAGAVRKTEWTLTDPDIRMTVSVRFAVDPKLQMVVPVEMHEDVTEGRSRLVGHAVYGRYRRFDVQVIEQVK